MTITPTPRIDSHRLYGVEFLRGMAAGAELRKPMTDAEKKILFGQRAK